MVPCKCKCGYESSVAVALLLKGRNTHCRKCVGVVTRIAFPSVGDEFGKWKVIGESVKSFFKNGNRYAFRVPCICQCGVKHEVLFEALRSGHSRGCRACNLAEIEKRGLNPRQTHGGSATKLYRVWAGIIRRCTSPTHVGAKYYFDKGIRVCQEWNDFAAFREWAIGSGYQEGLACNRKNADKDYSPENCEWITNSENCRQANRDRVERHRRMVSEMASMRARIEILEKEVLVLRKDGAAL